MLLFMSYSYSQRKKNNKRGISIPDKEIHYFGLTAEERSIAHQIRIGRMPSRFFAKTDDSHLERDDKGNLTWRTLSTYKELTKK